MKTKKVIFEGSLLLICCFYWYYALTLDRGEMSEPGPGFLPIVLGSLGMIISAFLLISTCLSRKKPGEETPPAKPDAPGSYRPLFLYGLTMALFILTLDVIGIVPGLFLAMVAFSKISGLDGWLKPAILGATTAIALYVIFGVIFQITMPMGLLSSIL